MVLRGVVDRVEDEVAVVLLEGGRAAFLPRDALPAAVGEGSGVELVVRLVRNPWGPVVGDLLDHLQEER